MTPDEIDFNLDELDNRLERLRALYEQYFLGIEKIEPQIARKDVDRRFWTLRRVQIRNTARRFRLQVLVQRYNTFQQYWARICREIENGTYRRHLIKAEKQFGSEALTHAARKRGRRQAASEEPGEDRVSAVTGADDDLEALLGSDFDFDDEVQRAAAAVAAPAPAVRAAPAIRAGGAKRPDIDDLDLDLDGLEGPGSVPRPQIAAPPRGPGPPASPPPAASPAPPAAASPPAPRAAGKPPLPMPRPATPRATAPGAEKPAAMPPAAAEPSKAVPAAPARPPAKSEPGLSEDRVRQLHAELVAAKRQLNQGGAVSVDGLAKSLRETAERLQSKHQGSRVDFQIVVKDGQAVVRPVVRK